MIMQRLKEETRPYHNQVEEKAFAKQIMEGSLTLNQYQELIYGNYLFHSVVETALEKAFSEADKNLLKLNERFKQELLKTELISLGFHIPSSNLLPNVEFTDFYEAMGALYVMEGSTLGGAMIKKALAKNPNIANKVPMLFYGCYGSNTGKYWKDFMGIMTSSVTQKEQEDSVVKAAINTFGLFDSCFEAANQGVGI